MKDSACLRMSNTFLMGGRCFFPLLSFRVAHLVAAVRPAFQPFMDIQLTFTADRRLLFSSRLPRSHSEYSL